ncbi:MAG: alpha/beta fold hydrolase [Deltaproteobacteria bacterium]|nr:alpha/beta fold hydrolase [Deltaproteobacteria bacterium]
MARGPRNRWAVTSDGWKLALYHYRASGEPRRCGPVMLCHGLGANRYNLAAPSREINLADYLSDRGHDVWVVELRGAGRSRPPHWPLRRRKSFDFDDYVQRDAPALIRTVLDFTGATSLHWVGHSMGGMIAYAAMVHFDSRAFRSLVAIAAPTFTDIQNPWLDMALYARPLLKVVRFLPQRPAGYLGAVFPRTATHFLGQLVANAEQMDPEHVRRLAPRVLSDLPVGLLSQLAGWYDGSQGFSQRDGLMRYWDHLDRVRAPLLAVVGGVDRLTPPLDLKAAFERAGSEDKELLVVDRAHGFSADYGHIDLVLGKRARWEVYPHIARWIEAH